MVKVIRYVFLCVAIFCLQQMVISQTTFLKVKSVDTTIVYLQKVLPIKTQFSNPTAALEYVQQLPIVLQAKGFLSASIDSLTKDLSSITIQLYLGKQYRWKQLYVANKDWPLINQLGFKKSDFNAQPFNQQQVVLLQEKLLDYFDNNGYPFAKIKFDSVEIIENEVTATLKITTEILYKLDSIRLYGNAKISKDFLYRYLNMQETSLYSITKLQAINQRLLELPYLQQIQPWRLNMLGKSYLLDLFLDGKRSNQIDAIVGFLPANQQLGGKLLFTVDAKINLQNAFATGENIALNWQQIQPKSPRLNFIFQRPYIFKSQFGLDFAFDLFKRDSSFLNINTSIGVQYVISAKQKSKILIQSNRTNLLDVDTLTVKLTKRLPDIIDVSVNSIAVEYELGNTNYKFNPQKGNELKFLVAAGNKKIRKNNSIAQIRDPNFNYNKLYDSINNNTYQLRIKLNAAQYFSLSKLSVIKTALQAGLVQSPTIFRNEMFQIGGYKLLRGFDEESIFTNQYAVATIEYRYLLGINSFFSGFTDIGYTTNTITAKNYSYVGVGVGLAFETKQGIFNINYAAGKRNDLPLSLRQSKIHIGFVSLF